MPKRYVASVLYAPEFEVRVIFCEADELKRRCDENDVEFQPVGSAKQVYYRSATDITQKQR